MDQTTKDLIYLVGCAVNGTVPDRVGQMDPDGIYQTAARHLLSAAVSFALQRAGVKDERITASIAKAQKKAVILEAEKTALFRRFEEAHIRYMPLKGAVLKDYYPEFGMREMADYDILIDAERAADVKEIMESLGFATERYNTTSNHDVYFKKPVTNFEIHKSLFKKFSFHETDALAAYYADIWGKLVKDSDNDYGYDFTDEDFYIYMTAHEFKHFIRGGTGLRSLLDTYVVLKRFNVLDWDYIEKETRKLGIENFEKKNRALAEQLFGEGKVEEDEMLSYMLGSGVYGNMDNLVNNRLTLSGSKWKYIWKRIFLPLSTVKKAYPLFYRHRILLPFLPLYRLYLMKKRGRSTLKAELKALHDNPKDTV